MRLKRLVIAGFRGFNEESVIDFDDNLTVVSAPNSHGKTSISEALEFLLYGTTSKVDRADSKDEYKDSYRNRHYPLDKSAYIEATFENMGSVQTYRTELRANGTSINFVDGVQVAEWPNHPESLRSARPFVLQHALKYLLLVAPTERFQGFAQLLGLNEVDGVFRALVSLCTKPSANVSEPIQRALNELSALEKRIDESPDIKKAAAYLKKGALGCTAAYKVLEAQADKMLGEVSPENERIARLLAARTVATEKVYSGDLVFPPPTSAESVAFESLKDSILGAVNSEFLQDYAALSVKGIVQRLRDENKLLELGESLLRENPDSCPLCGQSLDEGLRESIHDRHALAAGEISKEAAREEAYTRIKQRLQRLSRSVSQHLEQCARSMTGLIATIDETNFSKVAQLLGGADSAPTTIVRTAGKTAQGILAGVRGKKTGVQEALNACEMSLESGKVTLTDAEALAKTINEYMLAAADAEKNFRVLERDLAGPARLLRQEIDALAGTAAISLLIEALSKRPAIEKSLQVRDFLEGLKDLKKHTEQTLAETMDAAMSTDLTASVMKWYTKIQTRGDPRVHFSGFAMDKTKTGDFKSRRLAVKAESYGVELASAVSSLSESKLNALGLCVSIASALRRPGPWDFLVIDDPIQSWDDEHEMQFIEVIRSLVHDEHKQIIVLSHKSTWAKSVCDGCRSLNGRRYEISSYDKLGPKMQELAWTSFEERLREAEGTANNSSATTVQLQQAEAELRLAACQLASDVAKRKLGRISSPHKMNKSDVRSILLTAGADTNELDRMQAMWANVDDAHHAPKTYQPNAQRIRQALDSIRLVARALA